MKKVVGVYGLSGSGKTSFCAFMRELSCTVIDADEIGRGILKKGTDALERVTEIFGREILFPDGSLNRKKLGAEVFADRKKLELLNSVTKPVLEKEIIKQIKSVNDGIIIVDCALLGELSITELCDEIILIRADKETLIKRLLARENIKPETAADRIQRQLEKLRTIYTAVIDNDGSPDSLRKNAKELYLRLKG